MVTTDSLVRFHPVQVRPSDDDPDEVVVGRPEIGQFVELPAVGARAIELLDAGATIGTAERQLAAEHDIEVDLVDLVEALREAGLVDQIDGQPLAGPHRQVRPHLPGLRARHVSWLFGPVAKLVYLALVAATLVTVVRRPELLPTFRDFFWTDYVGLAVLVNTGLFSLSATMHELSHLVAARSLGAPARIRFATRLHHLVLETDVTAIWSVPRRYRYRVYLSGLFWDLAVVCVALLVLGHTTPHPVVAALLAALVLVLVMSMALQLHVYMRTDFYFVLLDVLRCRNLFHDGLAYARHLLRRFGHSVLPARIAAAGDDPSAVLPSHERRAVRVYAAAVVIGSMVALTSFAGFGLPILLHGAFQAGSAVVAGATGGSLLAAVDGALVLVVEGTLQTIFLLTLYRRYGRRRRPTTAPTSVTPAGPVPAG
ncbi:PqqD family protein [Micromonospora endolithica]|uniref:PqqD family protein n=1 Tax=Micromonospora endolithica TaxID=230091 RepID=A0A3A9YXQ9_9ACTN|nr:PqqD family protein [Micromonospora endolithica]